jgi:hypothetical protein
MSDMQDIGRSRGMAPMASAQKISRIMDELTAFVASAPTEEQILDYHFSKRAQRRASQLLAKRKRDMITEEEAQELAQCVEAEEFLGLVKARIHARRATSA